ncbi:unnamed protein product [Leptidea sinapis]|uniref:C2H2-type domain-containing protein n=1 Tax=Leptidea sinapis TaxID=189913 RepID=A0A5E4QD06_9NEOP|nr:unnamed protein product [Leptidea sinapis]
MEAALPHFHRLASSRFYHQYAAPQVRVTSNYLHDLIPPQHPTLLQQYLAYYHEPSVPLDLSVKQTSPITPPCTPPPSQKRKTSDNSKTEKPPKIFRHFEDEETKDDLTNNTLKRKSDDESSNDSDSPEAKKIKFTKKFFDELRTCLPNDSENSKSERSSPEIVEIKDVEERPKKLLKPQHPLKKSKAVRRLTFDEDKTSPVSGTIIRDLAEDETLVVRKGDIDPAFNVVEVTEEAKALIASIENRLGRYICRLCRRLYNDAFALAQHRCSRIVHIEYRCPECDKDSICDNKFNNFWNKIPAPQQEASWDDMPARCASHCSSEDSRSLDVTGSEDEGGAGDG